MSPYLIYRQTNRTT